MDLAKIKTGIVLDEYKKLHADEYHAFCKQMKEQRSNTSNQLAAIKHTDILERKLWEIPETMYEMLQVKFNQQEWDWFKSLPGSLWFIKTYSEFRTAEKI